MTRIAAAFAAIALIAAASSPAMAAPPCKDAKGRFVKCPDQKPVKKAPCKDAKGKFVKCK